MSQSSLVGIALGSNLGQPLEHITQAAQVLARSEDFSSFNISSAYITPPLGPSQPDYTNAVLTCKTKLPPLQLLQQLQSLELQIGRDRSSEVRWGPRVIDLDIIFYDEISLNTATLCLPHPGFLEREFVLIPLLEIHPTLLLPNGKILKHYIQETYPHSNLKPFSKIIV